MEEVAAVVRAAAGGDEAAWGWLVDRFGGLVWAIARAHRFNDTDAADVAQTTWLRLIEHLDRIRDPERVGAWIATTARRECLRTLRGSSRQVPVGDDELLEVDDPHAPTPDTRLVDAERHAALWRAINTLPTRCRQLLRVLLADPPPSYEEVSAALDMPIGSIGPTRGRCLERLRHSPVLAGINADA
jgi:RNA polymerase sigma factor (sigma-70 family)